MADREQRPPNLVLFTRYPRAGETKTRLIGELGPEGAADLQRALTEHALRQLQPLAAQGVCSLEVHYMGAELAMMRAWLGEAATLREQGNGDLGQRMHQAIAEGHRAGCGATVIVGTDVPGITASHVERALAALLHEDVVLGPAIDGGYYLIALRRPALVLFHGIQWGEHDVLETTLRNASTLSLSHQLLEPLADVDRPTDLQLLHEYAALARFARAPAT